MSASWVLSAPVPALSSALSRLPAVNISWEYSCLVSERASLLYFKIVPTDDVNEDSSSLMIEYAFSFHKELLSPLCRSFDLHRLVLALKEKIILANINGTLSLSREQFQNTILRSGLFMIAFEIERNFSFFLFFL